MSENPRGEDPNETPTDRRKRRLLRDVDPLMDELVGAEAASAHGKPIARKQKLDALRRTIIDIAASGQQKKATGTLL